MRIGIFGLGNVLCRDDGFGPSAVRRLEARYRLPGSVVVVKDLGTPGLDLAMHVGGLDVLLLFDAVGGDGAPGSIRCFRKDEILAHPPSGNRVSSHEAGLRETLWLVDAMGEGPRDVLLIGAIAADVGSGVGLTPSVEAAVERALDLAVAELERLDAPPVPREEPVPTGAWWE